MIKRGTKLIHIVFLDDFGIRCAIAPLQDLRYLKEEFNSNYHVPRLKRRARQYLKKSPLTGAKREMTKKARGVLKEILDL